MTAALYEQSITCRNIILASGNVKKKKSYQNMEGNGRLVANVSVVPAAWGSGSADTGKHLQRVVLWYQRK